MRVLLNCSTLVKGGALQAAYSFIEQAADAKDGMEWSFVLSAQLYGQVKNLLKDKDLKFEVINNSPALNRGSRSRLAAIENNFRPGVVFTFFGPAYVNFKALHLCGFANPWVTHSGRLAFSCLPLAERFVSMPLSCLYRAYWIRKADAWIVEAEVARRGMKRRLLLPNDRIDVVPNNCGQHYLSDNASSNFPADGEKIRILTLSAYYRHKNLEIVPEAARHLWEKLPGMEFEFVLTLPPDSTEWDVIKKKALKLGVSGHVNNIGPVDVAAGPALYRQCHIVFLPSLLETFSANYPEAMASARPIVTTKLPFATDVCRDAAEYYNPADAADAANAFVKIIKNKELWERLVAKGRDVLSTLPTPKEKYLLYRNAIERLCRQKWKGP
ncbi:MAG: glycosyltransferase family 4 protein [Nitrospiraceae bacterium]|nr:glycosyltransferase family 4 protein [Nitrospiraceae bacterium]